MTTKTAQRKKVNNKNATKKKGSGTHEPRKRVQFAFDAPEANDVAVTGSFCDWQILYPLKRQKSGDWKRTIDITPGRHEYRFVVDGEWREDPRSGDRVPNPYGGVNSVLETS